MGKWKIDYRITFYLNVIHNQDDDNIVVCSGIKLRFKWNIYNETPVEWLSIFWNLRLCNIVLKYFWYNVIILYELVSKIKITNTKLCPIDQIMLHLLFCSRKNIFFKTFWWWEWLHDSENFGLVSEVTECIKGFTSGWLLEQWKYTCLHTYGW